MRRLQIVLLHFLLAILAVGCSTPPPQQPTVLPETPTPKVVVVVVTSTPKVVVVTNTPVPSSTPDVDAPQVWETPPSEVLLNYNPTQVKYLLPPAQFTQTVYLLKKKGEVGCFERASHAQNTPHPNLLKSYQTVAERKFQFSDPPGFRFRNSTTQSVMESSDQSIMFFLEFFEHKGKANALGFMLQLLKNEQLYKAVDKPQEYHLAGYPGWIVNIESPGSYEHGSSQIIVIDLDSSNLFYAIGIANRSDGHPKGNKFTLIFLDP